MNVTIGKTTGAMTTRTMVNAHLFECFLCWFWEKCEPRPAWMSIVYYAIYEVRRYQVWNKTWVMVFAYDAVTKLKGIDVCSGDVGSAEYEIHDHWQNRPWLDSLRQ